MGCNVIYFKFEKREPKPTEYRTLADVPEGVRCVVLNTTGVQAIRARSGIVSVSVPISRTGVVCSRADECPLLQVLDPIPTPPLPKTLADVEEGRCVKYRGENYTYFRHGESGFGWDGRDGTVWKSDIDRHHSIKSLTDIYAVRCEVER